MGLDLTQKTVLESYFFFYKYFFVDMLSILSTIYYSKTSQLKRVQNAKSCFNETKKTNINPWPLKWSMTTFGRRNNLFFFQQL